jgi:hypothetical protein
VKFIFYIFLTYAMNYPIPDTPEEIANLRQSKVNEEIVASAIAGLIKMMRAQGQTLEDLIAQLLEEDSVLDRQQRRWLTQMVTQAWNSFA